MEWRNVVGFPNYVVSDTGYVKNVYTGKKTAITLSHGGYRQVALWKNNKQHTSRVARLVAMAFCEGYFEGAEVNHKDENCKNDCASNLEWVTHLYNMNYGTRTKRAAEKLSTRVIGTDIHSGEEISYSSIHDAASKLGGSPGNICACLKGRQGYAYGHYWRYES